MSGLMHGIGDLGHALGDVGHALGDVGHVVGDHIPLVDHGHGIHLHYVQARDPDYEKAAAELILQLNAAEVQQGQLVSIDVHSNGLDQPAQFVAFFCPSLPRLGAPDGTGLKLAFESQLHQSYDWTEFYSRSHATAEAVAPHHKCDPGVRRGQLVAMTGHVSQSLEKALKDAAAPPEGEESSSSSDEEGETGTSRSDLAGSRGWVRWPSLCSESISSASKM